jgi:hypothetical protein
MKRFTVCYNYTERRIRTVEAETRDEAINIVALDAAKGDLDINAYVLDGHYADITDVYIEKDADES